MAKRLIAEFGQEEPKALEDLLLVMANCIEISMVNGGAVPGKDYTILDLYKLAQPFALHEFQKQEGITYPLSNKRP